MVIRTSGCYTRASISLPVTNTPIVWSVLRQHEVTYKSSLFVDRSIHPSIHGFWGVRQLRLYCIKIISLLQTLIFENYGHPSVKDIFLKDTLSPFFN